MRYKRKYKKGGKFKYQTGGVTDPPFGSSHDPLGNFLGFNRNVNATIPAPAGKGNAPSPFGFSTQDGYKPFPMPSEKKPLVGEGTVRRRARGPVTPTYPLPDQRQQSLLPDYSDPFEISHYGTPPGSEAPSVPNRPPTDQVVPDNTAPPPVGSPTPQADVEMNRNLPETNLGTNPESALANDMSVEGEVVDIPEEEGGGFDATGFLQFLPEAMNFATGVFGKDKTRPATEVSNRAVDMVDDRVNVNPQLQQARASYRAVVNNPNATPNQKLAAQAQMNNAMNQIYADKFNRRTQLRANKASLQSQLDSRRAGFKEQHRQDKMASEANLGLTGNFARKALSDFSTKRLQSKAQENQKRRDKRDILAYIDSLPEAAQKRILENMDF